MNNLKIWGILLATLIKRKAKLLLLGLLILVMVGVILDLYIQSQISKKVVSEGMVGTYTETDLPKTITSLLSRNLVKVDDNGNIAGDLVDSWQADQDAKVFTFKLKDNQYWSDGSKISTANLNLPVLEADLKIVDDKTFVYTLKDSYSPFPVFLDKPVFKKSSSTDINLDQVGTGPYKTTEVKKDDIFVKKLVLASINNQLPQLDIRIYPNEKIAKEALKLGEVQSLLGINDVSDYQNSNTFAVQSATNFRQLVTIFYNTKDQLLGDDNLRLALSYAAPSIAGEYTAITSIPPTSWAFNKDVRDYLDNPDQAKTYLAKAKLGDGPIVLTATASLAQIGQQVVDSWNKNGIKSVLRVESGVPQNFQALLIAQNIPADPDQYALWHSTQMQTNISKFSSPRIDKDLEDGRKIADINTRLKNYQDFQKILLDHAPATFLYFPKKNVVYLNKISSDLQKVTALQLPEI